MDKRRSFHYNAALKLATVNDKLIADNAALAARVKELEALLSKALHQFYHRDNVQRLALINEIEQALEETA